MSKELKRPAALVRQGNLRLYATSFRVADLLSEGFYTIERLDPEDPDGRGYQRILQRARAKKLADYVVDGEGTGDAFLPTSVLLATDKTISFDSERNEIAFNISTIGPFSVVDGQHRLEGLRLAAEKLPSVRDYEIPVNIAEGLSHIAQMCHFLIVNTTQRTVDRAIEQRIFARLTDLIDVEDVPSLPAWIRRIVETGDDERALQLVDYLNETEGSPWAAKIEMANQDLKGARINQKSFVKIIKRYVLTAANPLMHLAVEKQKRIFLNYWRAIAAILDDGRPTVLFKYNGVEVFCRLSGAVFARAQAAGSFKAEAIEALLRRTFENVEGDFAGVGHPDWWLSGNGPVSGMNAAALAKVVHELSRALHQQGAHEAIEI